MFKGKEVIDFLQEFEATDADPQTQVEVSHVFAALTVMLLLIVMLL